MRVLARAVELSVGATCGSFCLAPRHHCWFGRLLLPLGWGVYIERCLCSLLSLPDGQIGNHEIQLAGIVPTSFADFGFGGLDGERNDVGTSGALL